MPPFSGGNTGVERRLIQCFIEDISSVSVRSVSENWGKFGTRYVFSQSVLEVYTVNSSPFLFFFFFFFLNFLRHYCPNRISPTGNSGCFPRGKPAATESRYPSYGACRLS